MSTITTTKISSPEPQAVVLHLTQHSLKERGCQLAQELKGSKLLSLDEISKVQQWESEFRQMDVNNIEISEDVSIQLVFLLVDVIYPAIANTSLAKANQIQLLEFENKLKEMLITALPKNTGVDQFISECAAFDNEEVVFREKLAIIEACYEQQMQQLYGSANEINQDLIQRFEAIKHCLRELNANRQLMADQMHVTLGTLTQKVALFAAKLTANATQIQSMGQRLQAEKNTFQQILQECQVVFKKKKI